MLKRTTRNTRLLVQAALQHAVDDPALLAVQVGRKLPFRLRMILGGFLARASPVFRGIGALGSVMIGRYEDAELALQSASADEGHRPSRLVGEIAILVGRVDLVPAVAAPSTIARARWARGDLSGAIEVLENAGQGSSRQARRLVSEYRLLQPGFRLSWPVEPRPATRQAELKSVPSGTGLRVLHLLTNSLPHTQSGYSLRSHRILTAMRNQHTASIAVTRTGYPVMIGAPTARDEDIVDGIRYVRTLPHELPQTQEERLLAEVEQVLQLVEKFRPHVIHATTNYLNALVAQAVSDATGLPWVFEVRGLMEQTWVASHRTAESRREAEESEKYALISAKEGEQARAADAVVTLSATMANELLSRGVEHRDIALVPNGVDESLFEDHLDIAEARHRTGLATLPGFGPGAFLVGAVSALVDYEGYDVLLRAMALLLADEAVPESFRERVGVVIAGDGVARPGLEVLANQLGLANRVRFPGRVPREEARLWIESLDVVVVPRHDVSVARAVTPQKPIEAAALDRPVIASDLDALREVLTDSDGMLSGVLVPPDDPSALAAAIVRLGTIEGALGEHGAASRSMAQERAWPQQVRRYREVYERAIDGQRGGGVVEY